MAEADKEFLSLAHALSNIDRAHTDDNSDTFLPAATALALSSDPQPYESLRQIALDLHEETDDPLVAERILKACLLKPAPEAVLDRTRKLAEVLENEPSIAPEPGTESGELTDWMCFALALQHYRQGDDEMAKSWALRSLAWPGPNPASAPSAKIVLGLVALRNGNLSEAMEYFNSAKDDAGDNLEAITQWKQHSFQSTEFSNQQNKTPITNMNSTSLWKRASVALLLFASGAVCTVGQTQISGMPFSIRILM